VGQLELIDAIEQRLWSLADILRNWGRSGKLAERRHPIIGYRLYARKELDSLLRKVESAVKKKAKRPKPR
jgi:hypothetical protein